MNWAAARQAQTLYVNAHWRDRLHVALRLALCPFERLSSLVPSCGLVVDLGCGHGVLANMLALESPERRIVGVDPSLRKLAAAHTVEPGAGRVLFVQGDALFPPVAEPCRAVLLIDVLYLLSPLEQERALRLSFDLLEPGGVLLLKTMDDRPQWKAALNRVEEWLAVRVLRITLGGKSAFTFRPLVEWAALCRAIGFEARVERLDRGYYHPHGAVVGIRP